MLMPVPELVARFRTENLHGALRPAATHGDLAPLHAAFAGRSQWIHRH
jgi:hypothetical protein